MQVSLVILEPPTIDVSHLTEAGGNCLEAQLICLLMLHTSFIEHTPLFAACTQAEDTTRICPSTEAISGNLGNEIRAD